MLRIMTDATRHLSLAAALEDRTALGATLLEARDRRTGGTDLDVALRRALCGVQGLLRGRRIDLDVRVGVPRRVAGDREAVEALLVELLAGAIRHTADSGAVTVRVEDQDEDSCRVVVTDSGRQDDAPVALPMLRGLVRDVAVPGRRRRLHRAEALAAAADASLVSWPAGAGTCVTAVLPLA